MLDYDKTSKKKNNFIIPITTGKKNIQNMTYFSQ